MKYTKNEHQNFLKSLDREPICCVTTDKGTKVNVFNQPFCFPSSLQVWWAACTEDSKLGFLVDGKMLSFRYLDPPSDHKNTGWETIAFDPNYSDWLNKLRNIWFENVYE